MGPSSCRALACVAFLTATLAHSIDAHAQQSCSDGPSCYEAGQALLVEGEYGKAIIQFNKGYSFDKNGVFLVNIALCYAGLKKYDRAISFAKDASKEELPKEFAVFNASNLASYIVIDSSMSSAGEVKRALENKKDEIKDPDPDPDPRPTEGGGLSALGYTGIGLGVVGLASLGGSAYFATVYGEQLERIEARDPTQSREEAEQNQQTGLLLLGVGTGATIVGVGLLAFDLLTGSDDSDSKKKEERAATPIITTTPDGGVYTGVHLRF